MLAKLSDAWEDFVNNGDITFDNSKPQGQALENLHRGL
jgi:hypothetical protein